MQKYLIRNIVIGYGVYDRGIFDFGQGKNQGDPNSNQTLKSFISSNDMF